MSSKVKENGKNRARQFRRACKGMNLTTRAFFFRAALEANEANEGKPGWKPIDASRVANDFGNYELAERRDTFEAPKYVHDKIDLALGLKPDKPPRPAGKGRYLRRQRAHTGVHAHL